MIAELAERASSGGRIAIDTEFVSERRYQALLCLVQVAVPDPDAEDGVRTEVLDPLEGDLDFSPLARVLADPSVEVLMHAGRQDVAILRRSWNTEVTNVFDTQVAAGFLGFGNQEGYESLVRKVLRVKLKGSEGFTKWDRRPLTAQQLEYAGDDARLLLALGEELERRLDGAWPARVGARGVARPRGRERRARRRSLLREAASARPAERVGARGRARARRVARAGGAQRRPPARSRAARPGARGARPPHAARQERAGADPRPASTDAAPPRRRAPGGDRPRPRAPRARGRRPSRPRATRPMRRSSRSRRRSCATARWSRAWRWS